MGARNVLFFQYDGSARREQEVQDEEHAVRDIYFRRDDFLRFGWTNACTRCKHVLRAPQNSGGPTHTDQCRTFIIVKLNSTHKERTRIKQAEKRHFEYHEKKIKEREARGVVSQ